MYYYPSISTYSSPPTVLYSQERKGIRNTEYENLGSEFQRTGIVQQAVELFSLFLSSMFIILSLQFFFACSKLSLFTVVRKIPVKSTLSSVRKITMFFLNPGGNCHTLKMSKIPNKCVLQTQKHIALWLSQ